MEQNHSNIENKIKVIHIKDSGKDENGIYFYIGRICDSKKRNPKFIYLNGLGNPICYKQIGRKSNNRAKPSD